MAMTQEEAEKIAQGIVREVAELPDRTSPEDWPDALLVTADELVAILTSYLLSADQAGHSRGYREAEISDYCEFVAGDGKNGSRIGKCSSRFIAAMARVVMAAREPLSNRAPSLRAQYERYRDNLDAALRALEAIAEEEARS